MSAARSRLPFICVSRHSLSILLQLAVHPPVPLVGDEQHDDVALVEAEQRVVVSGGVGEDGAHAQPLHDIVEARGDRHGPGQAAVVTVCEVWEREEEEKGEKAKRMTITGMAGRPGILFIPVSDLKRNLLRCLAAELNGVEANTSR